MLTVVVGQCALSRRKRFEHHSFHIESGTLNGLCKILASGTRSCDDMNERLQASAGHAHGLRYAVLSVDDEFFRQARYDLPARWQRHGAGRLDGAFDVLVADLA